jgi:hypothetical protein
MVVSQAGRGLSGPSPGGMGAQGEFVKYEPLGGAYSMWRPEGGGSSDADGAPTDGGGGSTGMCSERQQQECGRVHVNKTPW